MSGSVPLIDDGLAVGREDDQLVVHAGAAVHGPGSMARIEPPRRNMALSGKTLHLAGLLLQRQVIDGEIGAVGEPQPVHVGQHDLELVGHDHGIIGRRGDHLLDEAGARVSAVTPRCAARRR